MVVDRHQPPAFDAAKEICQPFEVVAAEQPLAVVVLAEIVGRIEIEQRPRVIVAADELLIVQTLDGHPCQPVVEGFDGAAEIGRRHVFAPLASGRKRGRAGLAAIDQPLERKEPGGALNVGEGVGGNPQQPGEFGPAGELEPHLTEQRFRVMTHHPEQRHHLLGAIVDRLGRCRLRAAQEDATHADEGLGVEAMGDDLDAPDQPAGEVVFAAHPRGKRTGVGNGVGVAHDCWPFRRQCFGTARSREQKSGRKQANKRRTTPILGAADGRAPKRRRCADIIEPVGAIGDADTQHAAGGEEHGQVKQGTSTSVTGGALSACSLQFNANDAVATGGRGSGLSAQADETGG